MFWCTLLPSLLRRGALQFVNRWDKIACCTIRSGSSVTTCHHGEPVCLGRHVLTAKRTGVPVPGGGRGDPDLERDWPGTQTVRSCEALCSNAQSARQTRLAVLLSVASKNGIWSAACQLRCRTLTSLPHRTSLRISWNRLVLWEFGLTKVIR